MPVRIPAARSTIPVLFAPSASSTIAFTAWGKARFIPLAIARNTVPSAIRFHCGFARVSSLRSDDQEGFFFGGVFSSEGGGVHGAAG